MKRNHKFKVGDRVIYRWRGKGGRSDLDGMHGTVMRRHKFPTHFEYAVRFDECLWIEWMDLKIFNIPDGYGWSCTEEHLDTEDGAGEEDEDPDIKKQKKEEERTMAKRIDWASADFVIKRMMAEGKTQEEIAEKVGCSKKSIADRVALLKRTGAISVEVKTSGAEEQKANLNELEETLAAVISEQKEEIDFLQGRVRGLESEVTARTEEMMEAKRLAVKKEERIVELESEIQGVKDALGVAEASMDEERLQKELLAKELTAAREALESREKDCMDGIRDTLARYDARIKEISDERDRYLRLAIRLSESVVGL